MQWLNAELWNKIEQEVSALLKPKVLHRQPPQYLGRFICVPDLPGRQPLHSVGINRLLVKLSAVGSQAFLVVIPHIWNDLPEDITSAKSLSTFHRRLKMHLFTKSFPVSWSLTNPSLVDLAVVFTTLATLNNFDWLITGHTWQLAVEQSLICTPLWLLMSYVVCSHTSHVSTWCEYWLNATSTRNVWLSCRMPCVVLTWHVQQPRSS